LCYRSRQHRHLRHNSPFSCSYEGDDGYDERYDFLEDGGGYFDGDGRDLFFFAPQQCNNSVMTVKPLSRT
jgi:hypothetical protein